MPLMNVSTLLLMRLEEELRALADLQPPPARLSLQPGALPADFRLMGGSAVERLLGYAERRLGLRLTPLFLAHFDRRTAWRMLSYGSKVVAGQAFFRAASTIDRVVISLLLDVPSPSHAPSV